MLCTRMHSRYSIIGTDPDTGERVEIVLEAETLGQAVLKAAQRGVEAESVVNHAHDGHADQNTAQRNSGAAIQPRRVRWTGSAVRRSAKTIPIRTKTARDEPALDETVLNESALDGPAPQAATEPPTQEPHNPRQQQPGTNQPHGHNATGHNAQKRHNPSDPQQPAHKAPAKENVVWSGAPSHWTNAGTYAVAAVLVAGLCAGVWYAAKTAEPGGPVARTIGTATAWAYAVACTPGAVVATVALVRIRAHRFVITSERLRELRGIVRLELDEVELYRVKDTRLEQTAIQRLVGIGSVRVLSSDKSRPEVLLRSVPEPRRVRELLRDQVEHVRGRRGVRELDMG